ncbi:MAG: response regulator [Candidatus Buchananbacteria bacterium]|nr:response regulator [Candidatus Buchananbacteria bacterium]
MATGKKVLIVEDDKFLGKMLSKMLEASNYQISIASSGKEGLTKAASENPDLILLDIMLPDIDGFEVLESLKNQEITNKIPVVILSNLGQPEDMQQGRKLGVLDYIVKSDLSLDDVVDKLNKLLPKK